MSEGRTEYIFTWLIENYTYSSFENGESFFSPDFTAHDLEDTVWCLRLYPKGLREQYKGDLSLFLNRMQDDGPEELFLEYELSVLAADGSSLRSYQYKYTFIKNIGYGRPQLLKKSEIILSGEKSYFSEDNLRLRCKMWKGTGNIISTTEISARTRFGIEEISFLHVVEGFSELEPNEKMSNEIKSLSKNGLVLTCSLYLTDGPCCHEKIIVDISPSGTDQILSKCNLFLLDRSGKKTECGKVDNRLDVARKEFLKVPLSLMRQDILSRKQEYLLEDKLSLLCECIFSTGLVSEKIEKTLYVKPFVILNEMKNNAQSSDEYAVKLSNSNSALDDFKELYDSEFLSDMTIKTNTKSFPTHKIVLSARSPVFRSMMTNDMKEKNSNVIQVDDIEDDILQKFLLFLYSDNIEALQWETAMKLYYAADKYAVEKLKSVCSNFLVDNVNPSSATELLLLADTHNDCDLKMAAEGFILEHEQEVYGSEDWENLIETNSKLVSKTMLQIHKRKIRN